METTEYRVGKDILATGQSRFINFIIDRIAITLMGMALAFVYILIGQLLDHDMSTFHVWVENMNRFEEYLLDILFIVPYYIFLEGFTGRSLGKFITKTQVVDIYGNTPDNLTILKRTFARIIPFEHFSFLGSYARGWHDSLSETYVVYKDKMEAAKSSFHEIQTIGLVE